MTVITAPSPFTQRGEGGIQQTVRDSAILGWRYLKRIPRIPELAIFAIIGSIIFVLLFAFVFGGAIPLPGFENVPTAYREFLMPGIFAQNIAFAAGTTAVGMADDMTKGIIDRFRSLPMARSAVLTGRSVSDVVYNLSILFVLMSTGYLVGWTWRTGVVELFAGVGLLLLFAFAMSWVGIYLGLSVSSPEVANQAIFTFLFPAVFVSNVFVPPATLPDFLQPIAEWNPVSTLTAATRELWGNPNPFPAGSGLAAREPMAVTLAWVVIILAIFVPLGIRKYRSVSR